MKSANKKFLAAQYESSVVVGIHNCIKDGDEVVIKSKFSYHKGSKRVNLYAHSIDCKGY